MSEPIRFGWFTADDEATYFLDGGKVPVIWQAVHRRGTPYPSNKEGFREQDTYEAFLPLENGLDAWLFGDLYEDNTWEVRMSLWVPCPEHGVKLEPDRCAFPPKFSTSGIVIPYPNCKGFDCSGCNHGMEYRHPDPGDEEEFWEIMKVWSSLDVQYPNGVPEHEGSKGIWGTNDV